MGVVLGVGVSAGCQPARRTPEPTRSAPSASAVRQEAIRALQVAENRRDAGGVSEAQLGSAEVEVRRAAARALARIASESARPGLLRLLGDEDAETAAFAAYGLGWTCREHEEEHVKALAARAVTLAAAAAGRFDPGAALARALGRCGTPDAEGMLVTWLGAASPRAVAASLGLGEVTQRRRLRDETLVRLTELASQGMGEALYPFGRGEPPGESVAARLREVAIARLATEDDGRIFAVRALGRSDAAAAEALRGVLTGRYREAERAEATRALGRLGEGGQQALGEALGSLLPATGEGALAALVSDGFGPLSATLEALHAPAPRVAVEPLRTLVRMALPTDAPAAVQRRVVRLRCGAAALLASQPDDAALLACDPAASSPARDLARLAVLRREPVRDRRRGAVLKALLGSTDARVRSEAYEVLGAHREFDEGAAELLVQGLRSPHAGTVAAAAKALALRAELTTPATEGALLAALDRTFAADDVETVSALLRAAGATRAQAARKHLDRHCASPSPTLRANAQAALGLLGDKQARCLDGPPLPAAAPELARLPTPSPRVIFTTDVGELTLTLDPQLAPTAAERLLGLAEAGFYQDMAVHRVVPGFVVQFGDRAGDGTGGAGRDTLRCETSPLPFLPLSVGVALDGRDTGSSQFFVTLARTPHLDGDYTLVGSASGDWAAVAEGDHIQSARVVR